MTQNLGYGTRFGNEEATFPFPLPRAPRSVRSIYFESGTLSKYFPGLRVDFQCRVIFMCVKFTFANKIEAMHERSLVSVKVEPLSTSRLIRHFLSCLCVIYVIKIYVC